MDRGRPAILAIQEGAKTVVQAVNRAGEQAGLTHGMPLSRARAVVPDLQVLPADPTDDLRGLERLALWCRRYSPVTAITNPDGLWIEATGTAHLFGGEEPLMQDLYARLSRQGLSLRLAMADTPGAAWAFARYGEDDVTCLPSGAQRQMLGGLPVEALRLPNEIIRGLKRLGFLTLAALLAAPRATLALRFGEIVTRRLDQALGRMAEPIDPLLPPELCQARVTFVEPIATAEAIECAMERLAQDLSARLEARGRGVQRLELICERVDGRRECQRLGLAQASRDPLHLLRLMTERIERIDPGFGIEAMTLTAWACEALDARQNSLDGDSVARENALQGLIDRLSNRPEVAAVYRWRPLASDLPERAAARIPASRAYAERNEAFWQAAWPERLPRPIQLFSRPEPLQVLAALPDYPPSLFRWRGRLHRVFAADGPERVYGEWWQARAEVPEVRDYFQVEDSEGGRYWVYCQSRDIGGLGDPRWYLHGIFG